MGAQGGGSSTQPLTGGQGTEAGQHWRPRRTWGSWAGAREREGAGSLRWEPPALLPLAALHCSVTTITRARV